MSFNISQFKNRDQSDVWLNLVGKDGKEMSWLKLPKEKKDELAEEIERFNAGTYDGDKLDEFKRPIRIKMKSPHGEAFRKAKMHRKVKDQVLLQGVVAQVQKDIKESGEVDLEKILDESTAKVCDSVVSGAKMIAELTVDWEGFTDDGKDAEFNPEILVAILSDPDNLVTYTSIIKAIDEKVGFFTA
jgi:hypothetical protein